MLVENVHRMRIANIYFGVSYLRLLVGARSVRRFNKAFRAMAVS